MIIRVINARVRSGRVGQFNAAIREQAALMREQPGLVYLKLARRLDGEGNEDVVLFEEWRDPDAVYGWAGPDLSKARLVPGAAEAVETVTVSHFEALDHTAYGDASPIDLAVSESGDTEANSPGG